MSCRRAGNWERLVPSGPRFATTATVLGAAADGATMKIAGRRIGPALVFERLWAESGCQAAIAELTGTRKHGFALERAVFLTTLYRCTGCSSAAPTVRRIAGARTTASDPWSRVLQLPRTRAQEGTGGSHRRARSHDRMGPWPEIIADLDSLTETEIEHEGKRFIVRSAPRPAASLVLRAAGVRYRRRCAKSAPSDP